jgi:hypothetical protein
MSSICLSQPKHIFVQAELATEAGDVGSWTSSCEKVSTVCGLFLSAGRRTGRCARPSFKLAMGALDAALAAAVRIQR